MADLFETDTGQPSTQRLGADAVLLRGFARDAQTGLLAAIAGIAAQSPFRRLTTPGGRRMSVAMTNCGALGWISDARGYRYAPRDPETGAAWPAMPPGFTQLASAASAAAGFNGLAPQCCLVNRYEPGAQLTLHQDRDEQDLAAPIVSVSLGLPAIFLFGGQQRSDPTRRWRLESGDVVVWGGADRLAFHGVQKLAEGDHPATGRLRYNLTFRTVR